MTKPQKNLAWGVVIGVVVATFTGVGAKLKSKL